MSAGRVAGLGGSGEERMAEPNVSLGTRIWIGSLVACLAVLVFLTGPALQTRGIATFAILIPGPPLAVLIVRIFRKDAGACSLLRVSAWAWGSLLVCVYLGFAISTLALRVLGNEPGAAVLAYLLIALLVFGGTFAGASFGHGRGSLRTQ